MNLTSKLLIILYIRVVFACACVFGWSVFMQVFELFWSINGRGYDQEQHRENEGQMPRKKAKSADGWSFEARSWSYSVYHPPRTPKGQVPKDMIKWLWDQDEANENIISKCSSSSWFYLWMVIRDCSSESFTCCTPNWILVLWIRTCANRFVVFLCDYHVRWAFFLFQALKCMFSCY